MKTFELRKVYQSSKALKESREKVKGRICQNPDHKHIEATTNTCIYESKSTSISG